MIGKSVPRVDAYEKVTGRAKFTDDLVPPRCLVAKVLHATIGNGIVKSIDTSEAVALEGVVKVVTFYDVPVPQTTDALVSDNNGLAHHKKSLLLQPLPVPLPHLYR